MTDSDITVTRATAATGSGSGTTPAVSGSSRAHTEHTPRFDGRTAIVTGAGSGIGRGVARAFARAGATVVVAGRSPDTLEQTVKLIEQDGGNGLAVPTDVTVDDEVRRLVAVTVERFGRLDVAVNNAGVLAGGPIAELGAEDWARMLEVNVTGVFLAMKHEIAAMRAAGGGAIVNIGSNLGAHTQAPGVGAYGATKAAVSALSKAAALENISGGIRINVVSPGAVDAPMSLLPGETPEQRAERFAAMIPVGRIGSQDEIASTVLWAASDGAGYLVGHDLLVDGGASL
ncbi:SDR family NAD(P)-dependent oxidoreductase [Phytoactinopolyspora halotolerans]|uniref:Glucose 1-dehydrogenase n=1 Tax=Phytoactinopolyspora halotolerans TaxID=1981512 RepID=A0A6L9S3Q7_9ACTN|nr:glucose 1-dehydrogenase [Phytoactinopolyspora halotolerans]NED99755.1 glucose 1-dehydrogenase [Phytoactinopolyspora halotolerans]